MDVEHRLTARRDALRAQFDAAVAELEGIREARADGTADDEHDPEGSTLTSDWSRAIGLRDDARAQLDETDAALDRLRLGTYGICEVCGRAIPPGRLEARPAATRCIAHAG